MNNSQQIDLAQLVQDISQLVLKSSYIIKEISQNFNNVYYKDNLNDPVTQADYLVQQTITTYLNTKYPTLKIIGEENIETDDQLYKQLLKKGQTMQSVKINQKTLIHNYPYPKGKTFTKISSLCLWIDPLDCTRGFVCNKKQQVTILVGISQNNKPIAGVIGQPFKKNIKQNITQFDPIIFLGSQYFNTNSKQAKYCFQYRLLKNKWKKWEEFDNELNSSVERKVAISSRRSSSRQIHLMKSVKMQRVQIGGAGSKFIKLIKKQVGTLMFVDARTSKWDSCAGQALVRAMGGYVIKPNLEQIVYSPTEQHHNNQGFIISLSKNIFSEIKEYISTQKFQNNDYENNHNSQVAMVKS